MELYYLITISDRDQVQTLTGLYQAAGTGMVLTKLGWGTATGEQLSSYGLSATQTLDLTAILGKKNLSSGIRVTLQDNVIDIACNLVVRMGQPVMTVAKNVQEGIANAVESMAGVRPAHVNVNVCGVAAPKAEQA